MPTVEFNFQDLSHLSGKEFKPHELKDRISMLGTDLEEISSESVIMEVFPDRPDLLSVEGFSRALEGAIGIKTGLKDYNVRDSGMKLFVESSVKKIRPFVVSGVIRDVSITDENLVSLMDIQEKLHITHGRNRKKVAIGVHDLSRIEPPFTYKAVKPNELRFMPLDMHEELTPAEILRRHPKGIAYAWVLEGLDRYPIILDRNDNVLSFPPIINGELTRVSSSTKDLFIEITGMDQRAINQALNILVTSIADRGGDIQFVEILTR